MFSSSEVTLTKERNQHRIRELIAISFTLGVNLTSPTRFKEALKVINVILTVSSIAAMYGHWSLFNRHLGNIPKIAETTCTAFQTSISIVKMIYYLFMQRKLFRLLEKAETHEQLQKIDIFAKDSLANQELKLEVDSIMTGIWNNARGQFIFFLCCCTAICCNYIFVAIFVNMYHDLKDTPNYVHILPYPSLYPVWEDKGMSFPYYHIQIFLEGAAVYISAMCAVSFDGLFIVLSLYGVGLIEVLKMTVKRSTSTLVPKTERVTYMRSCIFQYQRICEYLDELSRLYKHVSITQFLFSLIIFGIVLFQTSIVVENDPVSLVRMLMYISAGGTEIVIYCYNGQRLITASEDIALAFYSCNWYDESAEFKQLLRMMIMRTQRIFHVDISWFFTMSLPTFMSLVRTSGSYFLLLRKISV